MPNTTIRSLTFDILRNAGMTTLFGNPGSNELPFLKSFPTDFQYILGLHEGAVVGMADGFALATGNPVFVNLHAAAGTGNAMGALTNARYSHSPLVITAGQQARNLIGGEAMLTNVEATALPRPLVKWSYEPALAADVPRAINQAIHEATLPTQGPVYLSIPYSDWDEPVDTNMTHLLKRRTEAANHPSPEQLTAWTKILSEAKNPLLVLGPQVDEESAQPGAVGIAEALGCQVRVAPSEFRCPFPTTHPAFRGLMPTSEKGVYNLLDGHDVILVAGAPVFRYHQNIPSNYLPDGTRVLHLTNNATEAARAPFGEALVGSVRSTLEQLNQSLDGLERELPKALPKKKNKSDPLGAMRPENLFRLLNQLVPDNVTYVKEATATKEAFWQEVEMTKEKSFFFPAAGGLGFGLPAAVGVQLALPERRVVALIGDGSANYGITALWSAAQYSLPVIFIILKNGTYGALRGFSRLLNAEDSPGLDVPGIDFCNIARGYGVPASSASDSDTFEKAFQDALKQTDTPTLIEVTTTFE